MNQREIISSSNALSFPAYLWVLVWRCVEVKGRTRWMALPCVIPRGLKLAVKQRNSYFPLAFACTNAFSGGESCHSRFSKPYFIYVFVKWLKNVRFKIWIRGLRVGGAEYFCRVSEFIKWSDLVHCQDVFQVDYMHFGTKDLGCGLLKGLQSTGF